MQDSFWSSSTIPQGHDRVAVSTFVCNNRSNHDNFTQGLVLPVQRCNLLARCRHRPALGECVASFASTFPVAILEPHLNMYNKNSILFNIPEEQIATHSLEAKGSQGRVASSVHLDSRDLCET